VLPFLVALLFLLVPVVYSPSPLESTVLRLDPATIELGPECCVGETFTLAAKIDNVEYLTGVGIQIKWNTTYIEHISHIIKIPVESYPDGVLHGTILFVADKVNNTKGTYDCAVATLGGPSFNGSGTIFEITFKVKSQPIAPEPDAHFQVKFTLHDLADLWACGGIPHYLEHCNVTIYTASTIVRFDPATIELGPEYCVGETFTLAARIDNVGYLYGFEFKIIWNTTYLEYVNHMLKLPIEMYPDGILYEPLLVIKNQVNTSEGWYWLAVSNISPAPSFNGSGTAFEITFRVKYQPIPPEPDVEFQVKYTLHDLADLWACCSIVYDVKHCDVIIHAFPQWNIADINWDLKVDISDIILASEAYSSTPEESNWNPLVDVAPLWDKIDIFDLVTIASHYGEEYTP